MFFLCLHLTQKPKIIRWGKQRIIFSIFSIVAYGSTVYTVYISGKLHNINCMENGHVNECVENAECKKVNDEFKCQCKNGAEENGKCKIS